MARSAMLVVNTLCLFLIVDIVLSLFNAFNQPKDRNVGMSFRDFIKWSYKEEITNFITAKDNIKISASSTASSIICQSCVVAPPSFVLTPPAGWCSTGHDSVLILINTKADHFKRRRIIRETWIQPLKTQQYKLKISYVFVLGLSNQTDINQQTRNEAYIHRDISIANFIDEYNKLNFKTLAGFHLVKEQCSGVDVVFKTDDDMFINVFALQSTLSNYKNANTIHGNCFSSGYPHRSPTSKWYASYESYPHKFYPPFCLGAALLMTSQTCGVILNVARSNPLFHIEDVYISGLLAKASGVQTQSVKGFFTHKVALDNTCPWNADIVSVLLASDTGFYELFKQMMSQRCVAPY